MLPEALVPDGRDEDDVEPEPEPLVEPEALVLPEPETLPEEVDALPPSPPPLELELQPASASAPTKSGTIHNFLSIWFSSSQNFDPAHRRMLLAVRITWGDV